MTDTPELITRREALGRVALLLGGTLAASTILGGERAAWAAAPGWAPRTRSAEQLSMVAAIAEHIIPATNTPGARAAGVHRFIDVLLSDYYAPAERERFLMGLRDTNVRAMKRFGSPFLRCSQAEQVTLLEALDAESYPPKEIRARAATTPAVTAAGTPTTATASIEPPAAAVDSPLAEAELDKRPGWFFRRMKELTLLGYYTSEAGANQELRVNPMGFYTADLAYKSIGRSWA